MPSILTFRTTVRSAISPCSARASLLKMVCLRPWVSFAAPPLTHASPPRLTRCTILPGPIEAETAKPLVGSRHEELQRQSFALGVARRRHRADPRSRTRQRDRYGHAGGTRAVSGRASRADSGHRGVHYLECAQEWFF